MAPILSSGALKELADTCVDAAGIFWGIMQTSGWIIRNILYVAGVMALVAAFLFVVVAVIGRVIWCFGCSPEQRAKTSGTEGLTTGGEGSVERCTACGCSSIAASGRDSGE